MRIIEICCLVSSISISFVSAKGDPKEAVKARVPPIQNVPLIFGMERPFNQERPFNPDHVVCTPHNTDFVLVFLSVTEFHNARGIKVGEP